MSPGNVAREGIPFELFRSTYLGRHVARESYPQRQVARETPDLSLGIVANVVVILEVSEKSSNDVVYGTNFTFDFTILRRRMWAR
ncbi:hypothetical protein Tco_0112965 [Tanacetum coccineum]